MFQNIGSLVRNPLGIIALFISLIYGMSALLLGVTVSQISPGNQTILVYFIVLFPVATLGVFGWLVAGHHSKLYGPGDYRTDDGFLSASHRAQPGTVGVKLEQESGKTSGNEPISLDGDTTNEPIAAPSEPEAASNPSLKEENQLEKRIESRAIVARRRTSTSTLYTAQNLALQELENSLGGTVAREVRLENGIVLDGIIKSGDTNYIVEIKFVGNARNGVAAAAHGMDHLVRAKKYASTMLRGKIEMVLVIIALGSNTDIIRLHVLNYVESHNDLAIKSIDIRIFSAIYLLNKYNIHVNASPDENSTHNNV